MCTYSTGLLYHFVHSASYHTSKWRVKNPDSWIPRIPWIVKWGGSWIRTSLPLKIQGKSYPFSWLPSLKKSCPHLCSSFFNFIYDSASPPLCGDGVGVRAGSGGEKWGDTFLLKYIVLICPKSNSVSCFTQLSHLSRPSVPQTSPVTSLIHINTTHWWTTAHLPDCVK